jgi:hypothetical protein
MSEQAFFAHIIINDQLPPNHATLGASPAVAEQNWHKRLAVQ